MALALVHETGPVLRTRELLMASGLMSTALRSSLNKDLAARARGIRIKWFESAGKIEARIVLVLISSIPQGI